MPVAPSLFDRLGEESVTAMEASLSRLDELRDDHCLDFLEFDLAPLQRGPSGAQAFPAYTFLRLAKRLFLTAWITQTGECQARAVFAGLI
jgi:hypothetical protein